MQVRGAGQFVQVVRVEEDHVDLRRMPVKCV